MRDVRTLVAGLLAAGCSYDAGALGSSPGPDPGDTTISSTEGASSSTAGLATGGVATEATVGEITTGETTAGGGTDEGSTTGPAPPPLIDAGLLARWYVDEASEGQAPFAVIDHQPPGVDLELVYAPDSPAYATADDSRGLRWLEAGRGGRAIVDIAGTKLETELAGATQVTFELVVAVSAVGPSGDTSRFLHVGAADAAGDFVIGSNALDRLELRWAGGLIRRFEASFSGQRQVVHVVFDTEAGDAMERLRAYFDGVELVPLGTSVPDARQGLPLSPTSSLVLGNRNEGTHTFRGSLQYVAIYTEAFGAAEIEHNRSVLQVSDDAP
jgi:hypothetical protein